MTTAAELLKAARIARGLSQAQLARRAGVEQTLVSAYERGRREPGVRTLARLLAEADHEIVVRPRSEHLHVQRRIELSWTELHRQLWGWGARSSSIGGIETVDGEPVVVLAVELEPDTAADVERRDSALALLHDIAREYLMVAVRIEVVTADT